MSTSVMMTSSQSSTPNGNLKKRIRDTTRLLTRPNLPADMRREMERKLAALQGALSEKSQHDLEREIAIKYRMVKFFERKKAMRKLVSAQSSGNDEAVKAAQLDLAYVLHYPKDRKYISLYPKEASSEAVVAQREAIRKEIAEKLALLGAETMLAKVLKAKAADLQDSADEDDDEDEGSSEDDLLSGDDDEEEDDDSEGDSEDDSGEEEEDGDEFDSEDESDEGELNEDEGSSDDGFFSDGDDDDEEDEEDEDNSNDEDDFDSEDDEDDFDSEDDSDNSEDEEDESEEDSDEEEEGPSKKTRRN